MISSVEVCAERAGQRVKEKEQQGLDTTEALLEVFYELTQELHAVSQTLEKRRAKSTECTCSYGESEEMTNHAPLCPMRWNW